MSIRVHLWLKLFLWALPLAWLWFRLIGQLRITWATNPQYAYGWAVPFLCLYLVYRKAEGREQKAESHDRVSPSFSGDSSVSASQRFSFVLLSFLYAPVCLIQEANPGWSLATWPLAFITIGLTLLLLRIALPAARHHPLQLPVFQRFSFSDLVFPICFFLVAVPWPFAVESPMIQGLTRLNTALTVEVLGLMNITAMPQGNVIELASGRVGIDEACSGIRSLQATLMIALFLGEVRRLSFSQRLVCIAAGFALAMACNLARTLLLCWVAAHQGVPAVAGWHDPAGVSILVACFFGIWGLSWALQRAESREQRAESRPVAPSQKAESREQKAESSPVVASPVVSGPWSVVPHRVSLSLIAWLLIVEVGVAGWYRHLEANLPTQASWHISWPSTNSVCQEVPIPQQVTEMLRYDQARQVQWAEADGTRWQMSWYFWKPGQPAAYLARTHNPLICMPAAGYQISSVSPLQVADVNGLRFPFRIYRFEESGNSVHILYNRWEDRAVEQSFAREGITRLSRLRSIWTGRGTGGQRVVSLAIWGMPNAEAAQERLVEQLMMLLRPETEARNRSSRRKQALTCLFRRMSLLAPAATRS